MNIGQELEKAWQTHRAHIALKGYDSPAGRTYARLLISYERALTNGMREALTLSLTDQDFEWFCECILIDPSQARAASIALLPGVTILPESPPYSFLWGHDKRGKLKHYAVMEDQEFYNVVFVTDYELLSCQVDLPAMRIAS